MGVFSRITVLLCILAVMRVTALPDKRNSLNKLERTLELLEDFITKDEKRMTLETEIEEQKRCENKFAVCDSYKNYCKSYKQWMKINCPCVCAADDNSETGCENKFAVCDSYKDYCNSSYKQWMKINCPCVCAADDNSETDGKRMALKTEIEEQKRCENK